MAKFGLCCLCPSVFGVVVPAANGGEEWRQLKLNSRHSGNAADRTLATPLDLAAAIPLSDAVFTAPAIARGKAYVLDGAGVLWAIDIQTTHVAWRFAAPGGTRNCNNVSSLLTTNGSGLQASMGGIRYDEGRNPP